LSYVDDWGMIAGKYVESIFSSNAKEKALTSRAFFSYGGGGGNRISVPFWNYAKRFKFFSRTNLWARLGHDWKSFP